MSGGSFDYLCSAQPEDLVNRLDRVEDMANALDAYPGGDTAARDTRELGAYARAAMQEIAARLSRLELVWMAVEWHHSCDWPAERVAEALTAYSGTEAEA